MTVLNGTLLINVISSIMLLLMISIYALSCYWNIRYLLLRKKNDHMAWFEYTAVIDFLVVCMLGYLLIITFTTSTNGIDFFDIAIRRPLIFMLGCTVAFNARERYLVTKRGKT